jgi:hypothetical protein
MRCPGCCTVAPDQPQQQAGGVPADGRREHTQSEAGCARSRDKMFIIGSDTHRPGANSAQRKLFTAPAASTPTSAATTRWRQNNSTRAIAFRVARRPERVIDRAMVDGTRQGTRGSHDAPVVCNA